MVKIESAEIAGIVVPVSVSTAATRINAKKKSVTTLLTPVFAPKYHGRIERVEQPNEDWQTLYDKGNQLYSVGKYGEAYTQWGLSLKSAREQKIWTKSSGPKQIEILKKLALMCKTQNQPDQALEMYNLATLVAVNTYGKESAQVADLLLQEGRLFALYDPVKNFAKANELMSEAFRINEKLYGRMTIPTGDVAIAIAQLKENEKQFSEALSYWQLAIDIGDKLEPNTISCCRIGPRQGKARCLEQLGQSENALSAHRDVVAMCRAGARTMIPSALSAYSSCLLRFGKTAEAASVAAEALTFKK
jgi:tetratricopeptide (TPR) repeat protein